MKTAPVCPVLVVCPQGVRGKGTAWAVPHDLASSAGWGKILPLLCAHLAAHLNQNAWRALKSRNSFRNCEMDYIARRIDYNTSHSLDRRSLEANRKEILRQKSATMRYTLICTVRIKLTHRKFFLFKIFFLIRSEFFDDFLNFLDQKFQLSVDHLQKICVDRPHMTSQNSILTCQL